MKSLYIHIPFCKTICSYCDFCKMLYNEEFVNKYLEALNREVDLRYKGELLKTIYIGGGTPSSLSKIEITKLFSITNRLNLYDDYEFTIEANIADINEEFLILCKKNRINRLSIGIETINSNFFKLLNRHNDKKEIIDKIRLCKKYFTNINIDLMYGFNNQTIGDLKIDLDFFKSLEVPHISIYSLILEKNTKLYLDKVKPIDSDLESRMYYYIIDYLKNLGYEHYEISNFSIKGYESIHNLNYWNNCNYYGFGLGASGYIDNIRYSNTKSINNYIKGNFIFEEEVIDKNVKMQEEMICGLRKIKGVSKIDFKNKYNIDIREVFNIDNLLGQKLLCENEEYIYIPEDKLYISNSILINFIK